MIYKQPKHPKKTAGLSLVRIAKRIRHAPGLNRAEPLWDCLRPLYHLVIDPVGRGVPEVVGGCARVRIPPEFTSGDWAQYEPEAISAAVEWARAHPRGIMLDIGSNIGIFAAAVLFADPGVEVIAFDADLSSLAATLRLCRYISGNRLRVVCGLISDRGTSPVLLEEAARTTLRQLASEKAPLGDPGTTSYVCLTSEGVELIPRYSLDQLFANDQRQMLIKCDVEGAELLVLKGGAELLARLAPDILLSVHPAMLRGDYGHTVDDIRHFLRDVGYEAKIIAVDHEEHWWCSRRKS
jgi:FkbM family methyltransferase